VQFPSVYKSPSNLLNQALVDLADRYRDAWRLPSSKSPTRQRNKRTPVTPGPEDSISQRGTPGLEDNSSYQNPLPTLFGIIIADTSMMLTTLNAAEPTAPVRAIGMFDFNQVGYDVWNAFAVSIHVCMARDYMVELLKDVQEDIEEGGDPDA
jgi:hypothetical protein